MASCDGTTSVIPISIGVTVPMWGGETSEGAIVASSPIEPRAIIVSAPTSSPRPSVTSVAAPRDAAVTVATATESTRIPGASVVTGVVGPHVVARAGGDVDAADDDGRTLGGEQ